MSSVRAFAPALAWLLAAAPSCGGEATPACRVDADCASARCLSDGRCAPLDASPSASAGGTGGATSGGGACTPNGDGTIERGEVVLGPGLRATFRIAREAAVDLVGSELGGGRRRWNFADARAGDTDVAVETAGLEGAWYAGEFLGASYRVPLADEAPFGAVDGVFEVTEGALALRGLASTNPGPTATRLRLEPAAPALAFPLALGETFGVDAAVTGASLGVPAAYGERYESSVDAAGEVATPFGTFPVLRVRTTLTRTVGLVATVTRSFAFVSECYGIVATVRSRANEAAAEFSVASELRRLAP